jgi:hypothetical protein
VPRRDSSRRLFPLLHAVVCELLPQDAGGHQAGALVVAESILFFGQIEDDGDSRGGEFGGDAEGSDGLNDAIFEDFDFVGS